MNDNILYHALANRPRKYGQAQLTPPFSLVSRASFGSARKQSRARSGEAYP